MTRKQARYIHYLLSRNHYYIHHTARRFRALGIPLMENPILIKDWLYELNGTQASQLIQRLERMRPK